MKVKPRNFCSLENTTSWSLFFFLLTNTQKATSATRLSKPKLCANMWQPAVVTHACRPSTHKAKLGVPSNWEGRRCDLVGEKCHWESALKLPSPHQTPSLSVCVCLCVSLLCGCRRLSPLFLALCLLPTDLDIKLSSTAPVPFLSASHHDDPKLNFGNCKQTPN